MTEKMIVRHRLPVTMAFNARRTVPTGLFVVSWNGALGAHGVVWTTPNSSISTSASDGRGRFGISSLETGGGMGLRELKNDPRRVAGALGGMVFERDVLTSDW